MNIDNDEKIIKESLNTINTKKSNISLNVSRRLDMRNPRASFRKVAVGLAVACLSLMLCVPVMASAIPSFGRFLAEINSSFESILQPIQLVCEDNGIKMEVVSAMNDSEMTVVYITLQDLEGDRVDETIDLYDSYKVTGGSAFTSEVVNYNEDTKTATMRIQSNGGENLSGKELKFSFTSFISGGRDINTSLDKAIFTESLKNESVEIVPLSLDGISGGWGYLFDNLNKNVELGNIDVLKPNEKNIEFPNVDFMHISNVGFINGKLHVQTNWSREGINEHGSLYFTDNIGNKISIKETGVYFGVDESGNTTYGRDYIEYIFDLDNINIEEINLNADLTYNKNHVEGNWETKFKIEPVKEKEIKCNVELDKETIKTLTISPLGVVLNTIGDKSNISSVEINNIDGSREILDESIKKSVANNSNIRFISSAPLNMEQIKSITINGETINIE